jgi:hypothetical protein
LDVQFVIGDWRLYDPGLVIPGASIDHELLARELELVIDDPIWPLWRFREERPLAWVVEIIAPVVDAADAIWMASHQDTRRIAFTEEPIYLPIPRSVPTVIASHQPGARIRVEFPEPTSENLFVCVASAWMPGWVARSDNHVLHPVLPTNGAIMGVWVPEGTTTITLYYEPSSFRHGFLMTLVGLLILILSLTAPRACRARRGLSRKIDI